MCGIVGIWAKNKRGESEFSNLSNSLESIAHRGPDHQGIKLYSKVALGHRRLSVIDTAERSNQPFMDDLERYCLIFNGEIYNYRELRTQLQESGVNFNTDSDTEVLFHLLRLEGEKALCKLNGFFSFLFYDRDCGKLLFARDRMGIKPILMYEDDDKFLFISEFDALFQFNIDKPLNKEAINHYFGLTYIPAPNTLIQNAIKIAPGHYGVVFEDSVNIKSYVEDKRNSFENQTYDNAQNELKNRLYSAVEKRLVSDVPIGSFLSGGVDSSIIAAIAKHFKSDLKTFSVGFDHPFFDETTEANQVAQHINSDHHTVLLGKEDFNQNLYPFLDALDEPFADSSAFATFLLAKETRKQLTVALSGDGADELFGGYNKQRALLHSENFSGKERFLLRASSALLSFSAVNRSSKMGQLHRKVKKLKSGLNLDLQERYWSWCHFVSRESVQSVLKAKHQKNLNWEGRAIKNVTDSLKADQQFVLPNDMLKKVDLMSMANSLEVRTPFLDPDVVDFANGIPLNYKLNKKQGKIILKDTFKDLLPENILFRKKKGFEIPLKDWLGDQMSDILRSNLFSPDFLKQQDIFDDYSVKKLIGNFGNKQLGDDIYLIWSLIIFQHWWKNNWMNE